MSVVNISIGRILSKVNIYILMSDFDEKRDAVMSALTFTRESLLIFNSDDKPKIIAETGKHNKLKLALTSISREELHGTLLLCFILLLLCFLFRISKHTNTPTQIKTRQIHISCALPLAKGLRNILRETETHSQKETMTVSLFVAFTVLSLCLHTSTSEFLQFQLSTISAAPSFLPEAPSSFSASPPAMSPDVSPLFPTPGSSEMSPTPSESSVMPTIPSSLSPPNPDAVSPDPLLDSSPVGSPRPASSSVSLVSPPLSLLLVFLMLLLPFCRF